MSSSVCFYPSPPSTHPPHTCVALGSVISARAPPAPHAAKRRPSSGSLARQQQPSPDMTSRRHTTPPPACTYVCVYACLHNQQWIDNLYAVLGCKADGITYTGMHSYVHFWVWASTWHGSCITHAMHMPLACTSTFSFMSSRLLGDPSLQQFHCALPQHHKGSQ